MTTNIKKIGLFLSTFILTIVALFALASIFSEPFTLLPLILFAALSIITSLGVTFFFFAFALDGNEAVTAGFISGIIVSMVITSIRI